MLKRFFMKNDGSITVETAFVLPLVIAVCMIFIYYFETIGFQDKVDEAICNAVDMADNKGNLYTVSDIKNNTKTDLVGNIDYTNIGGSFKNISFNNSNISNDFKYTVDTRYKYSFPIIFFSSNGMGLYNHLEGRAFCGNNELSKKIVYITKAGKVYHLKRDCTYLQCKVRQVKTLGIENYRNASGAKYYPCQLCKDKGDGSDNLYITDYGTAYHFSPLCSALKKDVIAIDISETGSRTLCKKCGK